MGAAWSILTRVPQQGDSLELLVARMLTTGGTVLSDRGGIIPERFRITINHSTSHAHFYSVGLTLLA